MGIHGFREVRLRNIFGFVYLELESKHELVLGIRKFLQSLPRVVIIVIRYLFAFLHQ